MPVPTAEEGEQYVKLNYNWNRTKSVRRNAVLHGIPQCSVTIITSSVLVNEVVVQNEIS